MLLRTGSLDRWLRKQPFLENGKERDEKMKNKVTNGIVLFLFLAGIGLLSYPFVSNYLANKNQEKVVQGFKKSLKKYSKKELIKEKKWAQKYNEELLGNVVLTDPFNPDLLAEKNQTYSDLLNIAKNGVMGYVEIPAIAVRLPIYHGTGEEALSKGVGHLLNSSLPIGGKGTHAVLSGHTGLISAKMFNDLNALKKGDLFYLYVLKDVLAYKVDQIKVTEPDNINDLLIDSQKDYVTLVTCTPYGVNTHRLLVRGKRVPYTLPKKQKKKSKAKENTLRKAYVSSLLVLLLAILLQYGLYVFWRNRKKRKKRKKRKRRKKQ